MGSAGGTAFAGARICCGDSTGGCALAAPAAAAESLELVRSGDGTSGTVKTAGRAVPGSTVDVLAIAVTGAAPL
jgi:hypothetical protein